MYYVNQLFSANEEEDAMQYYITIVAVIISLFSGMQLFYIDKTLADYIDQPIATDSRIKTFVYNENEVFPIVLHGGYQTAIEFGKNEKIQYYSIGNNYALDISFADRTLFIKPMEENVITNMTLTTDKRRYYFDLLSKANSNVIDQDLVYAIRFFYPDEAEDVITPPKVLINNEADKPSIPVIQPYNFNYISTGEKKFIPSTVFDDGINTFIQYENGMTSIPQIKVYLKNKKMEIVEPKRIGDYVVVNRIADKIELIYGKNMTITINSIPKYEKK